jgi:hypothetical protein
MICMRHNELDREFPCNGDLIETQQSSQMLTIAVCLECGTEYRYVPDSTWVEVIYPGMRRSLNWET